MSHLTRIYETQDSMDRNDEKRFENSLFQESVSISTITWSRNDSIFYFDFVDPIILPIPCCQITALGRVVYPESLFIVLFSAVKLNLFVIKEQFRNTNLQID